MEGERRGLSGRGGGGHVEGEKEAWWKGRKGLVEGEDGREEERA